MTNPRSLRIEGRWKLSRVAAAGAWARAGQTRTSLGRLRKQSPSPSQPPRLLSCQVVMDYFRSETDPGRCGGRVGAVWPAPAFVSTAAHTIAVTVTTTAVALLPSCNGLF